MRIINSPPFATSCLIWQEQPDQWTLTVVCKATYSLRPGTSVVAAQPDEINEHDNHWDDDPEKSVYAPADLVPYKPTPEVLLVGSAYAPRGEPVKSLFVRLIVGQLDKSIEVFGARSFSPDGALVEGPRWTQMSLRYERAAGGSESWNPVGLDSSAADSYGRRNLPNLQPPAFSVDRNTTIPAIGFGPLAMRWPVRQEKLGALAANFARGRWSDSPLGTNFDGSYFQSAHADQFVDEIRPDEAITLENLHPDIERLVTRLPGIKPRTRVEIEGLPPWELALVADTLWIDTNRAACTVTFRGQLPLDGRDQPGTIFIGVEYPGEPVRFPRSSPPETPYTADDLEDLTSTNADTLTGDRPTALPFAPTTSPALPWDPGAQAPPPVRPPPPLPPKNEDEFGETSVLPAPVMRGQMPTWLDHPAESVHPEPSVPRIAPPAPPVPARQTPPAPVKPPPPVQHILRPNEVAPASLAAASHRAAGNEPGPAAFGPPPTPPIAPPMSRPVPPIAPPMNMPSAAGLAPPPPARTRAPTLAGITPPNPLNVPSGPTGTTFGQAAVLAAAKSQIPPVSSPPPDRESVRPSKPDSRSLASAAFVGAAEASTAAAATTPSEKEDKPLVDRASGSSSGPAPYRALVDLLWFAPSLPPRLEENAAWKRILEGDALPEEKPAVDDDGFLAVDLNRPQKRPAPPPPEKTPEQKAKEDKSRVSRVISRATATNDVEQALYLALNDDGVLEPPLCLVAGEFELPFDEVETLKVLTSAAMPLAAADKKLKETIDLANEAMGTPLGQSPEVAANFSLRIREAWTKANRFLPPDYLDVHSRRVLLEQRKYQKRELTGEQWIRGVVFGVSGDKPIPAYLPADAGKSLPLFQKFPARLIVEVLPPQDQYEVHPIALRVHVLARTITTRPRR